MNALFLVGRYGKKASANGICIENIINNFEDSYTIICYDDFEKKDNNKIYTLKHGLLDSLIFRFEKKEKISRFLKYIKKILNLIYLPIWPLTDPFYTIKMYFFAKKIVKKENIDTVVAVHMPLSSLIVGSKLKNKYPNIKYIAYFLDSLSGGTPLKIMSKEWNYNKKSKWEEKLLKNADKIIAMKSSKIHHDKYNYNKHFYNKLIYLDVPLYKKNLIDENNYFSNDKINISFCGTANYPLRNIPFILKVINYIDNDNIIFHFFGNSNYGELINSNKQNIVFHSYVEHDKIPLILNSSDFLLNLGTKETSTISGKIFEYMAYGKPIISTFSIENESCIPYLELYDNYILLDEKKSAKEESKKLQNFLVKNEKRIIDQTVIEEKLVLNLPKTFIDIIKEK